MLQRWRFFGLSLRVKQRTSYSLPLVPGHRPGEREELTVVALGSSMGEVGSDGPWISTVKKGMVKIQTLHSLQSCAPPNGLQPSEDSPLGVSTIEAEKILSVFTPLWTAYP